MLLNKKEMGDKHEDIRKGYKPDSYILRINCNIASNIINLNLKAVKNMNKRACTLLIVFLLILCFTGCSKDDQMKQTYSAKSEQLQEIDLPKDLPSETSDWLKWDRKSQWLKISETEDGAAQLFASNKENDKLYLSLGEKFYILNWASVRKDEEDVKLFEKDINNDKKNELIAISPISGSTDWYRERLYIIESDGQSITSAEFPLEKFEKYVKDNLSLNSSELKFFDLTLKAPEKNSEKDMKLTDEISSVLFSFESGFVMKIEISVVSDSPTTIAEIICELKYDGGNFSVKNASMIPI